MSTPPDPAQIERLQAQLERTRAELAAAQAQGLVDGPGNLTQGNDNVTTGAGGVAVGRDLNGNVIFIYAGQGPLDAERFWQLVGGPPPAPDLVLATARYLDYLLDCYRYLDLKGMGFSDRVPLRLPLLEMYVPLRARLEMPEGDSWERGLRLAGRKMGGAEEGAAEDLARRLSEPRPVLELLRGHDGLVLLGDPGAGKTTFLKFLAVALATGQGEKLGLGGRLPVVLPLAAYANALAALPAGDLPLERFLAQYYEVERGIGLPLGALIDRGLAEGSLLVLLDGLDEVRDEALRLRVVRRVEELFRLHRRAGNKFVLTSRIVGYREVRIAADGLAEATLIDFDDEEVGLFLEQWTGALERAALGEGAVAAAAARSEKAGLLAALEANPGIRALAANPLLLTILALMKRQGVTLPERRVELYRVYVETLLRNWNLARSLWGRSGRDLDVVETRRILAPLALWMHRAAPGVGLVKEGDLLRELERVYGGRGHADPEGSARAFLDDVRRHSALLLDRGGRQYGFIHLTFQEYLAAVALGGKAQQGAGAVVEALAEHVGEAPWHEVSLLTVGFLGIEQQWDEVAGAVIEGLLERAPGAPGEAVLLAGEAVADAGPGGVTAACRQRVVGALLETMRDAPRVPAVRRAAAGRVLARLGDPRPEVMTVDGMEFRRVRAGGFWMGSDKEVPGAWESESPRHRCEIGYDYELGRYAVTVAQFKQYLASAGVEARHPEYLDGLENDPVSVVEWYEAVEFCRWLTERWRGTERLPEGWGVSLPSEAEWEKAAGGEEGRRYPWGAEPDPERASYDDTDVNRPSAVGCFPTGASACGCEELSGNVWEWTRSLEGEYPYPDDPRKRAEREDLGASVQMPRVLRGGSYFGGSRYMRCAARSWDVPDYWLVSIGFRVVRAPFSSGL
jgi:formylglycine-generating enzyme required for sulfatase activity